MSEQENLLKELAGKSITWMDLARRYKPDITEDELEYILWNETCYPFHAETTVKQLLEYINKK